MKDWIWNNKKSPRPICWKILSLLERHPLANVAKHPHPRSSSTHTHQQISAAVELLTLQKPQMGKWAECTHRGMFTIGQAATHTSCSEAPTDPNLFCTDKHAALRLWYVSSFYFWEEIQRLQRRKDPQDRVDGGLCHIVVLFFIFLHACRSLSFALYILPNNHNFFSHTALLLISIVQNLSLGSFQPKKLTLTTADEWGCCFPFT